MGRRPLCRDPFRREQFHHSLRPGGGDRAAARPIAPIRRHFRHLAQTGIRGDLCVTYIIFNGGGRTALR
jgi:hypothetical protein